MVEAPLERSRPSPDGRAGEGAGQPRWSSTLAIFAWVSGTLLVALVAGAWLLRQRIAPDSAVAELYASIRFSSILCVLIGMTAAAIRHGRLGFLADLVQLRPHVDVSDAEWAERRALVDRPLAQLAPALGAGALVGAAVNASTLALAGTPLFEGRWRVLEIWSGVLTIALFALLTLNAVQSHRGGQALRAFGRRTRVRLADPVPLEPFARFGLRTAAFWLIGSSIASLLALDAASPAVVLAVIVGTLALGVASLLVPSSGIHATLRAAKRRELDWVREEIARERDALERAGDPGGRLPALLAWEARVEAVREWPFGTPTLLRFALFLLVPLGSWLGGALVERLLETWW